MQCLLMWYFQILSVTCDLKYHFVNISYTQFELKYISWKNDNLSHLQRKKKDCFHLIKKKRKTLKRENPNKST